MGRQIRTSQTFRRQPHGSLLPTAAELVSKSEPWCQFAKPSGQSERRKQIEI